jgi:hypothetical protein
MVLGLIQLLTEMSTRNFLLFTFLPMKMEQIECSVTSAYKIQTPGNHPEENIQQYQEYFLRGKGGRCVGLTNLPTLCPDCIEI